MAKLGMVSFDRVTPQLLDRTDREWLGDGLDPSTVHHLHRILSTALRQAVKWGLAWSAATSRATPPTRRVQPKQVPAREVVQTLTVAAQGRGQPVFAAAIAIAATTGLRGGELAGLRLSDVDLTRGRLHVERAIKNDLDGSWIPGRPRPTRPATSPSTPSP
jgi:integrase